MNLSCIYIINGPNLNLLGEREPDIYGFQTLADIESSVSEYIEDSKFSVRFLQSNYEGQLIEWIHEARGEAYAIIINPAAYTHTSIAILDALKAFERQVIEVHLSDVDNREDFRKFSYVSMRADKVISGQGWKGYISAIDFVLNL